MRGINVLETPKMKWIEYTVNLSRGNVHACHASPKWFQIEKKVLHAHVHTRVKLSQSPCPSRDTREEVRDDSCIMCLRVA